MILRVLHKIQIDKADGIGVVPVWLTQPWYPLFMSLVVSQPIYFEPYETLLFSPHRKCTPTSESFPCSGTLIREAFRMRGATEEAADIMMKSISDGTVKQYNKPIRLWWNFCQEERVSFFESPISAVLKFLTEIVKSTNSYSTVNIYI